MLVRGKAERGILEMVEIEVWFRRIIFCEKLM